jgi:tetratricopeptide (TPR) repeat protein
LLEADPGDPESLYFFGVLAARRSDPESAESYLRRAVDARPGWAKAWNNLGAALNSQGKSDAALAACGEAVRLDPEVADSQYNFGLALHACGRMEDAVEAFRKATFINPDFTEAFCNLGSVLNDMSRYVDSETAYRRAIEINPEQAEAYSNLGVSLRQQGRYADAEEVSRRAIELKPDVSIFYSKLAYLLQIKGEFTDAETACQRSIELDPTNTKAYRMLVGMKKIGVDDPLVDSLLSLAQMDSLTLDQQVNLHFALGKVFDGQQEFDTAFHHFSTGNRLQRSVLDYSDAEREVTAQHIMTVIDRELLGQSAGEGCPSDAPIFVLGMPRSGTTLTEQILASHSAVEAGGELKMLRILATSIDFPMIFLHPDSVDLRAAGEAYLAATGLSQNGRFTDKMPENYLLIGLIRLILPEARIINCRRTAADTCLSCYCINFGKGNLLYSYDLEELGMEYQRYQRVMAHWENMMPGTIYNLDYENLIDDQEGETRRLLDYCGLPFEEACLQFSKTKRIVDTASASQVRKDLYSTSAGRWKQYETHLEPLLTVLDG